LHTAKKYLQLQYLDHKYFSKLEKSTNNRHQRLLAAVV